METIEVGGCPVRVARRFPDRLRGLRGRGGGLLLAGRSVHGIGMRRPLWAVGLTAGGTVVAVTRLAPWRVVSFRRPVVAVLELPVDADPPLPGERLDLPISALRRRL